MKTHEVVFQLFQKIPKQIFYKNNGKNSNFPKHSLKFIALNEKVFETF